MMAWEPSMAVLPITLAYIVLGLYVQIWLKPQRQPPTGLPMPALPQELQQAPRSWRMRVAALVPICRYGALLSIFVSLLAPVYLVIDPTIVREGAAMMLVLDTSGSMQALDMEPHVALAERQHRLAVAKAMLHQWIHRRANDSIGLVIFGQGARTLCPLTQDHQLLQQLLEHVQFGELGENTAMGTGIGLATKRLMASEAQGKTIVLLTDGSNNAGSITPKQAANLAKSLGITIHTIGLGTAGQVPFWQQTPYGKQIRYMLSEIDEKTLHDVAKLTGGKTFHANDQQALAAIGEAIDVLDKSNLPEIPRTVSYPLHHWPLALAWLCCLCEWLLRHHQAMLIVPYPSIPGSKGLST